MRTVDAEPCRLRFYDGLYQELCLDIDESRGGADDILGEALQTGVVSVLELWEYKNLDEDGGTEWLQQQLKTGFNVFEIYVNNGQRLQDTPRYRKKMVQIICQVCPCWLWRCYRRVLQERMVSHWSSFPSF